ncbi:MAG: MFS transporter [Candidatus Moranbacteria bacterium]|nr:MFS transporter [Candidatus Moranbacteria bacterium]
MQQNFQANIWKYFIFVFTQRRNFLPILPIYFLTIPNAQIQQIGIYIAVGALASFLLEIPSGYFADIFGHKRTLVLSKIFMLLSSLFFIFATGFWHFVLGSVCISLGWSFMSGASNAFMYETFIKLKRERDYARIMSKISANVSLLCIPFIITLPFFTKINMILPFVIWTIFDLFGLFAVLLLADPKNGVKISKENQKSVFSLLKEAVKDKFFSIAIFTGSISAFMTAMGTFRPTYLESLGMQVVFLGFIMGGSRFIWFLIGHRIHLVEKFLSMKQHFIVEIFIFVGGLFLLAFFSNVYIVALFFILLNGYWLGREQLIDNYFLKDYIKDENYKATLISVRSQVSAIIKIVGIASIGFVMNYSYKLGYAVLGGVLLVILSSSYYFIRKH